MQYYAIIGDIKRSKKIENRCEIQEKLKKILDNVNSIYNNDISAKFLITLGDEFQGLLENNGSHIRNNSNIFKEKYIQLNFGLVLE